MKMTQRADDDPTRIKAGLKRAVARVVTCTVSPERQPPRSCRRKRRDRPVRGGRGKRGRFANGGDQSHTVLDTGRGAVAESLGRRDVVLGQGWQAKMTCDGTHSRNGASHQPSYVT